MTRKEYIKINYILKKHDYSSDNMQNLWNFLIYGYCFVEQFYEEILEAMSSNRRHTFNINYSPSIDVININKVRMYYDESVAEYVNYNTSEFELPFDILYNLQIKLFSGILEDSHNDKIDLLVIIFENEKFELFLTYKNGLEEKFIFESDTNKFDDILMEAEKRRLKEISTGDIFYDKENQLIVQNLYKVTEKQPYNSHALFKLGFYIYRDYFQAKLVRKGSFNYYIFGSAAIKAFQDLIKLEPNNPEAYFWLSSVYVLHDVKFQYIEELIAKALEKFPNRAEFYLNLAAMQKSIKPWSQEIYDRAKHIVNLQKVIAMEPTWVNPRIDLIEVLIKNNQYDFAKQEFDNALQNVNDNFNDQTNDISEFYETYVTGRNDGYTRLLELEQRFKE